MPAKAHFLLKEQHNIYFMKYQKLIAGGLLATGAALIFNACTVRVPSNIEPVKGFQADQYLGKWYEIARLPMRFEKNLDMTTANYSKKENGSIRVINRGHNMKSGKWTESEGEARFLGDPTTAALKVAFFKPFWAGYNVIDLVDYKYALVAGDSTKYLWILSRETTIPQEIKERFLEKAKSAGYQTEDLIWVKHSEN